MEPNHAADVNDAGSPKFGNEPRDMPNCRPNVRMVPENIHVKSTGVHSEPRLLVVAVGA